MFWRKPLNERRILLDNAIKNSHDGKLWVDGDLCVLTFGALSTECRREGIQLCYTGYAIISIKRPTVLSIKF